jgi:hypothetical protein
MDDITAGVQSPSLSPQSTTMAAPHISTSASKRRQLQARNQTLDCRPSATTAAYAAAIPEFVFVFRNICHKQNNIFFCSFLIALRRLLRSYCSAGPGDILDGITMRGDKVRSDATATPQCVEGFIIDFLMEREKKNGAHGKLSAKTIELRIDGLVDLQKNQLITEPERFSKEEER